MICPHCAFPNEPDSLVCAKCKRSLQAPASDAPAEEGPTNGAPADQAGWLKGPVSGADPAGASAPPPLPNAKDVALAAAKHALAEAEALEKSGDLRGAFVACQSVLIDHSAHLPEEVLAQLHLAMGRISIAQDKPERAHKYLEKAAALRPQMSGLSDLRSRLEPAQSEAVTEPDPAIPEAMAREAAPTAPQATSPQPDATTQAEEPARPAEAVEPKPAEVVEPGPVAVAPVARPTVSGRLAWVASFWIRALAFGLDVLLVCGLMIGMLALGAVVLDLSSQDIVEALAAGFTSLLLVAALVFGLLLIYLIIFTRFGGQTLGKMLFGLRVVRLDGHSVKTLGALRRGLGLLLAALPGLAGFLWAAFDLNRRGWHDRVAGTMVVRIQPPRAALEASGQVPTEAAPAASEGD